MTKRRKVLLSAGVALALLGVVWPLLNPPGAFGLCFFGFTTYDRVPRPIADMQIRADGSVRTVAKTHELTLEHVHWLLESEPEVLIVSLGWRGVVTPAQELEEFADVADSRSTSSRPARPARSTTSSRPRASGSRSTITRPVDAARAAGRRSRDRATLPSTPGG